MLFILAGIFFMIILHLLRGSRQFKSIINVERCGTYYWILFFAYIPIAILLIFLIISFLYNNHLDKIKFGYKF